jgi:hypothetical protein
MLRYRVAYSLPRWQMHLEEGKPLPVPNPDVTAADWQSDLAIS